MTESSNLQSHLDTLETGFPSIPAGQDVRSAGGESWEPMDTLPFANWKEAMQLVVKRAKQQYPQLANKINLWFIPMPLESIWQCGESVKLSLVSSTDYRKKEAENLRSIMEELLTAELFPGRRVLIEITEQHDNAIKTIRICDNHLPTQAEPIQKANDDDLPDKDRAIPASQEVCSLPQSTPQFEGPQPDQAVLDFFRERVSAPISDNDLQAVVSTLQITHLSTWQALEQQRQSGSYASPQKVKTTSQPSSPLPLDKVLVEPSYATTYDEIIHDHSAVYLPTYFVRHLRHMGASDGLRYMALRQIAYKHGFRDATGSKMFSTTVNELCRWSTLQPRRIYGGLDDPDSYLFLLAGKVPYIDYYAARPETSRWEDDLGYHWRAGGREFCVWKRNGETTNECSQLIPDRSTGELQWRQAPMVYRVQLSMPLCPEDEKALRAVLIAFGVREDPLNAIRQCLALPRSELIPDRPIKLTTLPRKLYTVQELVVEVWGRPDDREIAARVAVQSKLLETHLIGDHELLKIPFYLLEKWGRYLSPAQLWTAIIAMDHVYAGRKNGEYRDSTLLHNGLKDLTLWTEDEYSRGAARKIGRWLYPFTVGDDETSEHFNPWFSVFVSEILSENGTRSKNADNTVQMKLRILPLVPLCPEDTLQFAHKMGLNRLAVRDAARKTLALEITEGELAVYLPDGRTLRYSHQGELNFGEDSPVILQTHDRQLNGISIMTSEHFYTSEQWPRELFGNLETQSAVLSGNLESGAAALSGNLEKKATVLSGNLVLDPSALFGLLLKLLILNLYGIKKNSLQEKPPSEETRPENVDSLEQLGSRQGQFIQWTEVDTETEWDFSILVRTLGISDGPGLKDNGVEAIDLVATTLELYTTPVEKFTTSRISVLVTKLRRHPHSQPGVFLRLAELGPDLIQDYFRRAILSISAKLNDPDWDQTLGRAKRNDLIELAEKLGLARVFRSDGS